MGKRKISLIFIVLLLMISPVLAKEPGFLKNIGPGTEDNPREDNIVNSIIVAGGVILIGLFIYMMKHPNRFKFLKPLSDYLEQQDQADKQIRKEKKH